MRTSKVVIFASAIIALMSFAACGVTTRVNVTTDQAANFKSYQSFGWLEDKLPSSGLISAYDNEIVRNNIRHYASTELQNQGYKQDNAAPDVWLQLQVNDRPMQEVRRYTDYPYSPLGGFGSRLVFVGRRAFLVPSAGLYGGYGYPYTSTSTRRYDRSSLTINIIDRATNRSIGVVEGITETDNPKQFNKYLQASVAKIIKKSPLSKKS